MRSWFRLSSARCVAKVRDMPLDFSPPERYRKLYHLVRAWVEPLDGEAYKFPRHEEPWQFLARDFLDFHQHYRKNGVSNEESYTCALWRTTRRYLDFIRWTWLAGKNPSAFNPKRYFKRSHEVEAFEKFTNGGNFLLGTMFPFPL